MMNYSNKKSGTIYYFNEISNFQLKEKKKITAWLKWVIHQEQHQLNELRFIFCSDNYLYGINLNYLAHNTLTDVITFSYADQPNVIEGEIYISVMRVQENASKYQNTFKQELYTVMVHGLLHLLGYNDYTKAEKCIMRQKEKWYTTNIDFD